MSRRLNYSYGYVIKRGRYYLPIQLSTSVKPDSYQEKYSFKEDSKVQKWIAAMSILFAVLFVLSFEFGWIDPIKEFLLG